MLSFMFIPHNLTPLSHQTKIATFSDVGRSFFDGRARVSKIEGSTVHVVASEIYSLALPPLVTAGIHFHLYEHKLTKVWNLK